MARTNYNRIILSHPHSLRVRGWVDVGPAVFLVPHLRRVHPAQMRHEKYCGTYIDPTPYPEAMRMTKYDAIVIGAGHNGLIAASYLAKAGHSVIVLDGRALPSRTMTEWPALAR